MAETVKRVCVIGAGASGLTATKVAVQEGFEVVCLERSNDIGGLWRFTEKVDGKACCMKSTVINTSKEMQVFSDFPPDANMANFMHNSMMFEYFQAYAKQFDLYKHIKFGCDISTVEPLSQSAFTKWRVTYTQRDGDKTGESVSETFDAVMVCTGHHGVPYVPEFEGMQDFKGEVRHSHELRDYLCSEKYEKKRVVVIGIGNSGLDCANEVGQVAAKTYIVGRRGAWILGRYTPGGLPADFVFSSRLNSAIMRFMGYKNANNLMRRVIEQNFDHSLFGLRPDTEPMADHPYVSDALLNSLQTGRVELIRSGIKRFAAPRTIEFSNGGKLDDVDMVLMCTGYRIKVPFIADSVLRVVDNRIPLYLRCVHPEFHSLMFIGYVQPVGPTPPISEMQSRLATAVFRGDVKLPSRDVMQQEIEQYDAWSRARFVKSLRHTIEVDYLPYMDTLASIIGVKPNLTKLLFTDYELFKKLMFEGCTPYQFRLHGRFAWKEAREAIMTQKQRIEYACAPKCSGSIEKRSEKPCGSTAWNRFVLIAGLAVICSSSLYYLWPNLVQYRNVRLSRLIL